MSILQYQTTPGANTSVDGINIAEGMPPGNVNNAMRSMMADTRKWQLDMAGVPVTGGTGNAFTLTVNQNFPSYDLGQRFTARFSRTNTGPATMNVNGMGAVPLRFAKNDEYVPLADGDLSRYGIYDFVYQSAESAFVILNTTTIRPGDMRFSGVGLVGSTTPGFNAARVITLGQGLEFNDGFVRVAAGRGLALADGNVVASTPTLAQAQAGTNNDTLMTPLNVTQHMNANALGYGQEWQTFAGGARASGTVFTNSTGRPIQISAFLEGDAARIDVSADGTTFTPVVSAVDINGLGRAIAGGIVIPPGHRYRPTYFTFRYWRELR